MPRRFDRQLPGGLWRGASFRLIIFRVTFRGEVSLRVFGPFFDQVVCRFAVKF